MDLSAVFTLRRAIERGEPTFLDRRTFVTRTQEQHDAAMRRASDAGDFAEMERLASIEPHK